mmetsp:Transcript_13750/g.18340  ORF Transcript_13750/g.18340 Transcript_13750/m.18340 type:complete len:780 (+) Transcript_13750:61-2400(+)|eukprot:CAMPEP_0197311916 /NCGR_PEP_ID=MMETSP0891-20130614/16184_1 /TAXON_ID=44058 ORGANISM="Aureoumbra lagunensis, Strain CCMP1510" /NCGR_SAMPLE_ID=MMETSP0891 /ASSEMBLY_ACC=CAM_ASM_000534 /LENGTH=779 /DNA_ID=CAMNT_0042798631 /DNA_START=19 /DNA_END=2358 /DNA_ORIENTATION=+
MNFAKRAAIQARHMAKHKSFGGGQTTNAAEDDEYEAKMAEFQAYEQRTKTLLAMTMDARAQLNEAFLQLGLSTQHFLALMEPETDVGAAAVSVNTQASQTPNIEASAGVKARASRACAVAGMLQEAYHASFGEYLQEALLAPLESELELFEKTKQEIAKRHEAVLEHKHYASKVQQLQTKASDKDKEKEKLQRNNEKAAEASQTLENAKATLNASLAAHDAARIDLLDKRVTELKGMLHRFCEKALGALGISAEEAAAKSATIDLDKYNIYGDVNVESAVSRMRRGLSNTTKSVGGSVDSVAMRLQHMRRHAGAYTTSSGGDQQKNAETSDPVELETNAMASRYQKAWLVLEKLVIALHALGNWYQAGFTAFTGVAAELAAAVKDTDPTELKAQVLAFHAALDEVKAVLEAKLVAKLTETVEAPLNDGIASFKDLPGKLRERREAGLDNAHYAAKVSRLQNKDPQANDKAAERFQRNKTKATEAEEKARNVTLACREQLLSFDQMVKGRIDFTAIALDDLQREFYLAFAAKVAAKLQLDTQQAEPKDIASAQKLQDLMAKGVVVPQSGMTLNKNAAAEFQRYRSNSGGISSAASSPSQSLASPSGFSTSNQPVGVGEAVRQASIKSPTPLIVAPDPQQTIPTAPPLATMQPTQEESLPAPQNQMAAMMGRKASLSAQESEQVRAMMQQANLASLPEYQAPAAPPPPPPPPPPARAPPGFIEVKALFDFAEVQDGDLGFKQGDIIITSEADFKAAGAGGWISGEIQGRSGVFPSNYVQPL